MYREFRRRSWVMSSVFGAYRQYISESRERGGGFSLVELIAVLAIIMALSGIAIPLYSNYIYKAQVVRAIAEIRMIEKEIIIFRLDNGSLPCTLDEIGRENFFDPWGNPYEYLNIEDFQGCGQGQGGGQGGGKGGGKGKGGLPGKARKDRFQVPLNNDYDLYSVGRDGKSVGPLTAKPSHDDVIRAYGGEFVGLASEH